MDDTMAAMEDELNVLLKKLQSQEKVLLYIHIIYLVTMSKHFY